MGKKHIYATRDSPQKKKIFFKGYFDGLKTTSAVDKTLAGQTKSYLWFLR